MSLEDIKRFFEPESVAIVGASRNPTKFGHIIVRNLQTIEYPGRIFPVNPNAEQVLGIKSYASVSAIGEKPDIVIVVVPADLVPEVMKDCAQSGTKNVLIISSGFNEAGEPGRKRLDRTLQIARLAGIRILGPNTTGIVNTRAKFTTTFMPISLRLFGGSIAFIAQTGMFAGVMLRWLLTVERLGISKVAGIGNKCDVNESDILEYLYEDQDTKAIMIYMEGIGDIKRFLETARKVSSTKPVVVLKGGRTTEGAMAALSHTGSISGNYNLVDKVFQQYGIVVAYDLEQMVDFAKILAFQPCSRGPRMGIVSMSGGVTVMASDMVTESGLKLARLEARNLQRIQKLLPDWAIASHPFDIEPLSETLGEAEAYRIGLEILLNDRNVDMCLVSILALSAEQDLLISKLEPLLIGRKKPIAVSLIAAKSDYDYIANEIEKMNVPVYPLLRRAIISLSALYRYAKLCNTNI